MNDSDVVQREMLLPFFQQLPGFGSKKHKGTGEDWLLASCPSHSDEHPSLGLSKRGVLRCWSGCSFKEIMRAMRDRFPEMVEAERGGPTPIPMRHEEYQVFATYNYCSLDGELLAVKKRLHHTTKLDARGKPIKTFRWHQPDGTAGLDEGGLAHMPLWLDPDFLNRPDARVFFCEGEAATQAVRDRGELAVCSGGGANEPLSLSALEALRNREVIIWRDNDPPGFAYSERLKNALRYIAKSVRVIVAPGNPKDDAVEFFASGGSLDDLLGDIHPIVECLASNHWRVTVPTENGKCLFSFEEMGSGQRGELSCELTVVMITPGNEPEPYSQRINLLSHSARNALESSLGRQFGKEVGWTTVVSKAYGRAIEAYRNEDRLEVMEHVPDRPSLTFLIDTLLPEGQVSMFYAPPANHKSYLAGATALSVALGVPFCGLESQRGPVVIVDYEGTRPEYEVRMERLLQGMGLDPAILPDVPVRYWPGKGVPFADQADAIRRSVQRIDAKLLIIDSAGYAVGGDMFSPNEAMRFFAAIARIGITTLVIGQVPAADKEKLYGNQYWEYSVHGRIWLLKRGQEGADGADDIDIALVCRKASNGRWPHPLSMHIHFDGDTGPVSLESQDFREVPEFARELSAFTPRIKHWLLNNPGLWTIVDIANGIKEDTDETWRTLRDGRNTDFYLQQGTGVGEIDKWGLLASG